MGAVLVLLLITVVVPGVVFLTVVVVVVVVLVVVVVFVVVPSLFGVVVTLVELLVDVLVEFDALEAGVVLVEDFVEEELFVLVFFAAGAGTAFTVTVQVYSFFATSARIATVPGLTPVTTPELFTVAIFRLVVPQTILVVGPVPVILTVPVLPT